MLDFVWMLIAVIVLLSLILVSIIGFGIYRVLNKTDITADSHYLLVHHSAL